MEEVWKDVVRYEGLYEISSLGRIRRIFPKFNYLSLKTIHNGYISISLCKNAIVKTVKIHRIIAEAFIPNLENKPTVNHKDGNKLNNKLENLEWATWKENMNHADDNKLRNVRGEDNHAHKLKEKDIPIIKEMYNSGNFSYKSIGDLYGVTKQTIRFIIINKTWKYVSNI